MAFETSWLEAAGSQGCVLLAWLGLGHEVGILWQASLFCREDEVSREAVEKQLSMTSAKLLLSLTLFRAVCVF